MKIVLLIGCAGFIGTLLRYACTKAADHLFSGFPWGTYVVNVTGAFAAGFLFLFCREKLPHYGAYFPVLFAGFLGSFTTFSTFMLESSRFLADGQYGKFTLNILLQNLTGLAAACAGLYAARFLTR